MEERNRIITRASSMTGMVDRRKRKRLCFHLQVHGRSLMPQRNVSWHSVVKSPSLQLDFRTKDILFYNMKLVLVRRLLFLMYFLLGNILK